ncbi:MAG: hypothetical protein JWR45_3615 [Blastococcus sp.]|jgi:hypothetical protein|nr:hypothetical protein [Blastococcus sp.]
MSRKPHVALFLAWAACVAGALLVARMPDDPGSVPTGWLVVLTLLGILAARGSRAAWAGLVGLHVLLVASFLLLAWPIGAQLAAFYALAALALLPLLAVPLLAAGTRRVAVPG